MADRPNHDPAKLAAAEQAVNAYHARKTRSKHALETVVPTDAEVAAAVELFSQSTRRYNERIDVWIASRTAISS